MEKNRSLTTLASPVLNTAAFIIVLAGIMYASSFVTLLLLAIFITIICAQPLAWLSRRNVPHGIGIVLVLGGINIILFVLSQMIGRSVVNFSQDSGIYAERLNKMAISIFNTLNDRGINVSWEQVSGVFDMGKVMDITTRLLADLGSIMGNTLLIMFIVLFMLLELNGFAVKTLAIVGAPNESLKYLTKIGYSIRSYLGIKSLISLLTGVLIWIGLKIIGVEYAVLWAMIAFLLNYIPNVGSFIAGIPAVLFALVQLGIGGALWTIGIYGFVNLTIGSVVEPRVMGKGMGLSTLVVFLSLIFWGFILGSVGMFLSVPLTITLKVVLEHNPITKWIAILLGTQHEAEVAIERRNALADSGS